MAISIDLTPAEIRREGWEALVSKLGVAKSLRFLLEYEKGLGTTPNCAKNCSQGKLSMTYLRTWPKKEAPRGRNLVKRKGVYFRIRLFTYSPALW